MRIILFLLMLLLTSSAQTDPGIERLSLDEAIEMLKTQNLEIRAAELDRQSAQADIGIAEGNNWGKLDFIQNISRSDDAGNVFGFKLTSREANFNDFGFDEFLGQMSGLPGNADELLHTQPSNLNYPDARNFYQSKLLYMLPLYTGGKLSSYASITRSMEKMKTLDKAGIINEKVYQLRKSYYDMALLENSIKHLDIILNNIMTLEKTIDAMAAEGYAKEVDQLEIQAKRANVSRHVSEMKANQHLLYHYISFLLNRKVTDIELPESDIVQPAFDDATIIARNIDIQKATTGLKIRQKMVDVSKANYLPEIGAMAEYSTADDSFLGDASDHKAYTIGARLTWNLFNGGIDSNKMQKAKVEHLKMQTEFELAKKGISLQIDQIRTEIESLDQEIAYLAKELELADRIAASYEARYHENLASMSDVIIKQSAQVERVLDLQMIKNRRNERIFALEKLSNGVEQ